MFLVSTLILHLLTLHIISKVRCTVTWECNYFQYLPCYTRPKSSSKTVQRIDKNLLVTSERLNSNWRNDLCRHKVISLCQDTNFSFCLTICNISNTKLSFASLTPKQAYNFSANNTHSTCQIQTDSTHFNYFQVMDMKSLVCVRCTIHSFLLNLIRALVTGGDQYIETTDWIILNSSWLPPASEGWVR